MLAKLRVEGKSLKKGTKVLTLAQQTAFRTKIECTIPGRVWRQKEHLQNHCVNLENELTMLYSMMPWILKAHRRQ